MTHPEIQDPTACQRRVLDDGTAIWPLWFEISPRRFVNGANWEMVRDLVGDNDPQEMGWPLATLRRWYPRLADAPITVAEHEVSAA